MGLQTEVETLKKINSEKIDRIESLIAEGEKNKLTIHKVQDQMLQIKNENAILCQKIEAQLKSSAISERIVQQPTLNNSQDSANDLELTMSLEPSVKQTIQKKSADSKPKSIQLKNRTIMTKYTKRKKLLDDQETKTLFDDFEFDPNLEDSFPTLPKRYTKRKKTIGI